MTYVIRKGVPLPLANTAPKSKLTEAIAGLAVGEMLEIPDNEMPYVRAYQRVKGTAHNLGHKVAIRKLPGSIGVWMLERGKRERVKEVA